VPEGKARLRVTLSALHTPAQVRALTDAIGHARERYAGVAGLSFERADAAALPFADAAFDLVVSFETLEHLAAQRELVAGFARVLADDGILLLSSPDRATYSDAAGFRNEFHVRELYRDELLALLAPHFPAVALYGQKLLFQSVLWSLDAGTGHGTETWTASADGSGLEPGLGYAPLYFIALCCKQARQVVAAPRLSLFGDRDESVYAHYNHEIRKNMQAGARIAELEAAQQAYPAANPAAGPPNPSEKPHRRWRWWRRNPGEQ
jgi:SAM-dependent methyltransferase